jgi:tRNA(adenine34) deaminase
MGEALKVAAAGLERGELPIGAVVVLGEEIVAAAHTTERAEGRFLVHAELLALDAADRIKPFPGNRRDVRLFVTLEPCLMCLGAAMAFFLSEVYYALESPGDGAAALVQGWQRDASAFPAYRVPAIRGGILRQESLALFQEYASRHPSGAKGEWARTLAAL